MQQILENQNVQLVAVFLFNTLLTLLVGKYAGAGKVWAIIKAVLGLLAQVEVKPAIPAQVKPGEGGADYSTPVAPRGAGGKEYPTLALLLVTSFGFTGQGCSFFRSPTFWDTINTTCEVAMAATPEVQAKAKALGGTVGDVATVLCGIADVIEPFVRQEMATKEGRKLAASATVEAVAAAKAKGLL
jgi:hypothetical protein